MQEQSINSSRPNPARSRRKNAAPGTPIRRALFCLALIFPALALSAADPSDFSSKRTTPFRGDSQPICAQLPIEFDFSGEVGAYKSAPATPNPFASLGQNLQANTYNPNERLADEVRAQAAWPQPTWVRGQFEEAIASGLRDAGVTGSDASADPSSQDTADCPYRLYLTAHLFVRVDMSGIVIVMEANLLDLRTDKLAYRGRMETDGPLKALLDIRKVKLRKPVFIALPAQTLSELITTTAQRAGRVLTYDLRTRDPRALGKRRSNYMFGWGVSTSMHWAALREDDLLLRNSGSLKLVSRPRWVEAE